VRLQKNGCCTPASNGCCALARNGIVRFWQTLLYVDV